MIILSIVLIYFLYLFISSWVAYRRIHKMIEADKLDISKFFKVQEDSEDITEGPDEKSAENS